MQFFVKHLYLLAPVLAIAALFGVYRLIKANDRPIPHYEPKQVEDTWSAEEYMRHLNDCYSSVPAKKKACTLKACSP